MNNYAGTHITARGRWSKTVLHNEPLSYGGAMSGSKHTWGTLIGLWASLLLVGLPSLAAGSMADYTARERFVATWWPGHVTLDFVTPKDALEERSFGGSTTSRAFLEARDGRLSIVIPSHTLIASTQVNVRAASGKVCRLNAASQAHNQAAPLTRVPACRALYDLAAGLRWEARSELGVGRRVWLLEQPNALQADGPAPAPIAIQSALLQRAPAPLTPYWLVGVRGAVGAPLLSDKGEVVCVIFRANFGEDGHSLCAPLDDAFKGLSQ